MMKADEIKDLISFIAESGLAEVNLETDEIKLHIKRHAGPANVQYLDAAPKQESLPAHPQPASLPQASTAQPAAVPPPADAADTQQVAIKSPMIGTFYRASSPDNPPFVSVGDKVEKGTVVCIVEAMKLFNEIESEVSGTIVKVVADNASPVQYDDVLFLVQPD